MLDSARVRRMGTGPERAGDHVLYWMVGARRTRFSPALDHALGLARERRVPLLVFEPLGLRHRWANHRSHAFVIDGMRDNQRACDAAGVQYVPFVATRDGEARDALGALVDRAAVVVTDDTPSAFLPRMLAAAASLPVRVDAVDGNGIVPLSAHGKAFPTAFAFRRHLHGLVLGHLMDGPGPDPLDGYDLGRAASPVTGTDLDALVLDDLPIDGSVPPVGTGGPEAAGRLLATFVATRLGRYADRNRPESDATSGLSPHLHFGHISSHEVVRAVLEDWSPEQVNESRRSRREGFWGTSPEVEGFLNQVITWRELGYGFAWHRPDDLARYDALPAWAVETLDTHASDVRPYVYDLDTLDAAATHDPLWNAAQTQLVEQGTIHNYLRMLWGKKILEWSASPREALAHLVELNNRYALDGRDPNSYSGIMWTLGRFDRAWGPERPIFGKVRYMSSDNTARKVPVKGYLQRWQPRADRVAEP